MLILMWTVNFGNKFRWGLLNVLKSGEIGKLGGNSLFKKVSSGIGGALVGEVGEDVSVEILELCE